MLIRVRVPDWLALTLSLIVLAIVCAPIVVGLASPFVGGGW